MDTFGCYPGIFSGDIVKMAEGKRWKKLMTGLARLGKVARGGGTFHLLEKQRGGRWILANRILFRNLEKMMQRNTQDQRIYRRGTYLRNAR